MELQFKNKHIFFALEGIWSELHYKFKYHINQLVTANSDDEYLQTVTVDSGTLINVYKNVSAKPEGVAKGINEDMLDALAPQLNALSNMDAVLAEMEEPNEAALTLIGIKAINQANEATLYAKIVNGKTQILE